MASDEIATLKDTFSSLKTRPPHPLSPTPLHPNQCPESRLSSPPPPPAPTPPTSPPPTSLALPWRCTFLLVASASSGFYINYAIKGNAWHDPMGGASLTTCSAAMVLYYFASLDRHDHDDITDGGQRPPLSNFKSFLVFINRRENRSLAVFGLSMTTCEVSSAIGSIQTGPNGIPLFGLFILSMIFSFNRSVFYFASRIHNVISQMSPPEISSYLSTNILAVGISSIMSMMYLSMDTIKCANNVYRTLNVYDQCSGVFIPSTLHLHLPPHYDGCQGHHRSALHYHHHRQRSHQA